MSVNVTISAEEFLRAISDVTKKIDSLQADIKEDLSENKADMKGELGRVRDSHHALAGQLQQHAISLATETTRLQERVKSLEDRMSGGRSIAFAVLMTVWTALVSWFMAFVKH